MTQGLTALAGIRYVLSDAEEGPEADELRKEFLGRPGVQRSQIAVGLTLETTRNGRLVDVGGAHSLDWYLKSRRFQGFSFVFTPFDYATNFELKAAISQKPDLAARCSGVRITNTEILESCLDPTKSLSVDRGMPEFIARYGIVPAVVSPALRSTSLADPARALSLNIGCASPVTFSNWALALRHGDYALCVFEPEWSGTERQLDYLNDYARIVLNPQRRVRVVLQGEPRQFELFESITSEDSRVSA